MKRILLFLVIITLFTTMFLGCATSNIQAHSSESYCRVEAITEKGFVVNDADNDRSIFVKYEQANQFEEYDTVVIDFSEEDLIVESGAVVDSYGYEVSYSYILENVKNIRPAGPGEPTFA